MFCKEIFNTFMHLMRKNSIANKGKHHVFVSHVGKLEGKRRENHRKKEKRNYESWWAGHCSFHKTVFEYVSNTDGSEISCFLLETGKGANDIQLQRKVEFLKITNFCVEKKPAGIFTEIFYAMQFMICISSFEQSKERVKHYIKTTWSLVCFL